MSFIFGALQKSKKELACLKSQSAVVELADAELKYVCGGAIGPDSKNPAGQKPPGQTSNPNPGK